MSKNDDDSLLLADAGPVSAIGPAGVAPAAVAATTAIASIGVSVASAAAVLSPPPMGVPVFDDEELAHAFARLAKGADEVLVIANAYTVCVFHRPPAAGSWRTLCCGELGQNAVEAAKPLARKRLTWSSVDGAPWDADPEASPKAVGNMALLRRWLDDSDAETGREGDITASDKEELTYLAGWRCQFAGCGRDLKRHGATGRSGRFSYFAHIVAASKNGPRGDTTLSKLFASDLSNFLLLCDECHRLIDKKEAAKYTVEVLRKMREDNIAEVARLLGSLQYKQAEVIAVVGNIAGQPPQFGMDDAHEALWGEGLRSSEAKPTRYFYPGGQNHDVHSVAYWTSLFQQMQSDLPALQTLLNGTRSGTARPRLAIFPLHSTSVLLLAGRVLGDAAGTQLFQPHRNKVGPGNRWTWPDKAARSTPPLDKFKVEELRAHVAGEVEAVLIVALTSDIEASRMPANCASQGQLSLPTLRITGPTFDKDCMQQPEDLQLVGLAIDAAMRHLQDDWHVRKVHLFVSAPTSAAVVVGQKMQARHHAEFVCHEAVAGAGSPYKATIEITPTLVRELVSGLALFHSLQP